MSASALPNFDLTSFKSNVPLSLDDLTTTTACQFHRLGTGSTDRGSISKIHFYLGAPVETMPLKDVDHRTAGFSTNESFYETLEFNLLGHRVSLPDFCTQVKGINEVAVLCLLGAKPSLTTAPSTECIIPNSNFVNLLERPDLPLEQKHCSIRLCDQMDIWEHEELTEVNFNPAPKPLPRKESELTDEELDEVIVGYLRNTDFPELANEYRAYIGEQKDRSVQRRALPSPLLEHKSPAKEFSASTSRSSSAAPEPRRFLQRSAEDQQKLDAEIEALLKGGSSVSKTSE